jgi:hypothetical protein
MLKGGLSIIMKSKRGQIATITVAGVVGLIFLIIVSLVLLSTVIGADLFTSGSDEHLAAGNLSSNFTSGVGNIASKIPTIMLVVAVVILIGALAVLYQIASRGGLFGSRASL